MRKNDQEQRVQNDANAQQPEAQSLNRRRDKTLLTLVQGLRSLQRCTIIKHDQLRQLSNQQCILLREIQELEIRHQVMLERLSQATIDVTPNFYKQHNISKLDSLQIDSLQLKTEASIRPVPDLHLVNYGDTALSLRWMPKGINRLSKEHSMEHSTILDYLHKFKDYWCACGVEKPCWQVLFERFLEAAHKNKR